MVLFSNLLICLVILYRFLSLVQISKHLFYSRKHINQVKLGYAVVTNNLNTWLASNNKAFSPLQFGWACVLCRCPHSGAEADGGARSGTSLVVVAEEERNWWHIIWKASVKMWHLSLNHISLWVMTNPQGVAKCNWLAGRERGISE